MRGRPGLFVLTGNRNFVEKIEQTPPGNALLNGLFPFNWLKYQRVKVRMYEYI